MATARQAAFRTRQTAENIAARQAPQPPSGTGNSIGTGNRTVGSVMLKGIGVAPKGAA